MRRKIVGVAVAMILCFSLFACGTSDGDFIGYWMDESGDTLSFTDEENCVFNGTAFAYKTYDEDHIQFTSEDGSVSEGVFYFEEGDLYLKGVDAEEYVRYTKDEEEQQTIRDRLKIQEQIAEIQGICDELAAKKVEYQDQIDALREDIQQRKDSCEEAIAFGDDREYHENLRDSFIAADEEKIQICQDASDKLSAQIADYEKEIENLNEQLKEIG